MSHVATQPDDPTVALLVSTTLQPDTVSLVRAYVGRMTWRVTLQDGRHVSVVHLVDDRCITQYSDEGTFVSDNTMLLLQRVEEGADRGALRATCPRTLTSFKLNVPLFSTLRLSPDGSFATFNPGDPTAAIGLWTQRTNSTQYLPIPGSKSRRRHFPSLMFGPDNDSNTLYVWTDKEAFRMDLCAIGSGWKQVSDRICLSPPRYFWSRCFSLSRNCRWFVTGVPTSKIEFSSLDATQVLRPPQLHLDRDKELFTCIELSVSGKFLAVAVRNVKDPPYPDTIRVYEWGSFRLLWQKRMNKVIDTLYFNEYDDTELITFCASNVFCKGEWRTKCSMLRMNWRTNRMFSVNMSPFGEVRAFVQVCV